MSAARETPSMSTAICSSASRPSPTISISPRPIGGIGLQYRGCAFLDDDADEIDRRDDAGDPDQLRDHEGRKSDVADERRAQHDDDEQPARAFAPAPRCRAAAKLAWIQGRRSCATDAPSSIAASAAPTPRKATVKASERGDRIGGGLQHFFGGQNRRHAHPEAKGVRHDAVVDARSTARTAGPARTEPRARALVTNRSFSPSKIAS